MKLIISQRENALLQRYPKEERSIRLLNLRFEVWLKYNHLKPDALTKARMRQAYCAGAAMGMQKPSLLNRLKGLVYNVKIT
jgi:hypothetical protein